MVQVSHPKCRLDLLIYTQHDFHGRSPSHGAQPLSNALLTAVPNNRSEVLVTSLAPAADREGEMQTRLLKIIRRGCS